MIIRLKLLWLVLLWPLAPLLYAVRIELHDGVVRGVGSFRHRRPVHLDASTPIAINHDPVWLRYRGIELGPDADGQTMRISLVTWAKWRKLLDAIDPDRRVQRPFAGWDYVSDEDDDEN